MLVILVVLITHVYSSLFSQPWYHHYAQCLPSSTRLSHLYIFINTCTFFTLTHSLHLHILYTCTFFTLAHSLHLHIIDTYTVSMPTQCRCHTVSIPTQCRRGVYTLSLSADHAYRSLMPTDQNKHT